VSILRNPVCLPVIASTARSYDISPNVLPSLGERLHMIPRKLMNPKLSSAIQTHVLITAKKEFILKWWVEGFIMHFAITCNDTR